jgi:hypothetical protein
MFPMCCTLSVDATEYIPVKIDSTAYISVEIAIIESAALRYLELSEQRISLQSCTPTLQHAL